MVRASSLHDLYCRQDACTPQWVVTRELNQYFLPGRQFNENRQNRTVDRFSKRNREKRMSNPSPRLQRLFNQPREIVESRLVCTEEVHCILCSRFSPSPSLKKRIFGIDYQGFELAECCQCGLRFLSKRPSRENLFNAIYASYWNDDRNPQKAIQRNREIENQIARIESFLQPTTSSLQVLDVGCGDGLFLQHSLQHGWQAKGTEIIPETCDRLQRELSIEMYQGFLPEISFGSQTFDVIRLNQVLEHTIDPWVELYTCQGLLKNDGILFISVPNAGSFQYFLKDIQSRWHLKKNPYKHYAALHHLWFFSRKTLTHLCQGCEFEPFSWSSRVPKRPTQTTAISNIYSRFLETLGYASIQDIYCRKKGK